ncbi:MAG: hypothetical protein EKK33_33640 [Bradyrhizobiaceae bacterium]|nr:MAG: hypothetical protein EKK33_33640 [Bradyrhizobiaceae bacterium]
MSRHDPRHDTARSQRVFSALGGEHARASGCPGRDVRGRQKRVVLTPAVLASSLAVMWQPTGTRIDHPQGDGGNSASLPGESAP